MIRQFNSFNKFLSDTTGANDFAIKLANLNLVEDVVHPVDSDKLAEYILQHNIINIMINRMGIDKIDYVPLLSLYNLHNDSIFDFLDEIDITTKLSDINKISFLNTIVSSQVNHLDENSIVYILEILNKITHEILTDNFELLTSVTLFCISLIKLSIIKNDKLSSIELIFKYVFKILEFIISMKWATKVNDYSKEVSFNLTVLESLYSKLLILYNIDYTRINSIVPFAEFINLQNKILKNILYETNINNFYDIKNRYKQKYSMPLHIWYTDMNLAAIKPDSEIKIMLTRNFIILLKFESNSCIFKICSDFSTDDILFEKKVDSTVSYLELYEEIFITIYDSILLVDSNIIMEIIHTTIMKLNLYLEGGDI